MVGWRTAAHCLENTGANALRVSIGGGDLLDFNRQQIFDVTEIYVHSDYEASQVRYDFGLIKLEGESPSVTPVAIPTADQLEQAIAANERVFAIGRGQQTPVPLDSQNFTAGVTRLYELEMVLISNVQCNNSYNNLPDGLKLKVTDPVTAEMLCAGTVIDGTGTCFGDSGGPLLLQQSGVDYYAGITSWGLGCAQPEVQDVFSRVPAFTDMIGSCVK